MPRRFVLLSIALTPLLSAADWLKIGSANFTLLTDAGEYNARRTLALFEDARAFFLREQPFLAGALPPATIVSFNNPRDYRPFSPRPGALAYFLRREQGDFIVTGYFEDEARVTLHEYAHLLVSHSGLSIPLWLNEGLAELYSTLELSGDKLLLGRMKKDRVFSLGSENWMRLPVLLRVNEKSPEYNEENRATIFYAQSCLLAHMLMLGDGYRDKSGAFLDRVSSTGSSDAAFREIYGKSAAEIEQAMRAHFRQMIQGETAYEARRSDLPAEPARPLDETELAVTQAILTAHLGRAAGAQRRLSRLAAAHPSNGDVEAALAETEALSGNTQAALSFYRAAIGHGAAGWGAYWAYARLLDDLGGDMPPRLQALSDGLRRNPGLPEARLRLARNLSALARFSDALAQLRQDQRPAGAYASRLFVEMARAALGLNQTPQARECLDQARTAARRPEDRAAIDRLATQIEQAGAAGPAITDPGRPILRRQSPPATTKK